MPDPNLPQYTFLPWLRRGVGSQISEADRLGGAGTGVAERARVQVELTVDYQPKVGTAVRPLLDKEVHLIGPGEITGLKHDQILRRVPSPSSNNFPASNLVYADFYEEDLPWRYTPARAASASEPQEARHKLRPWLSLLVLAENEFKLDQGARPLPVLELVAEFQNVALPREDETWAWAHVQVNEPLAAVADAAAAISARPDKALSRLVSPRRLEKRTRYTAFLVPTFETGRRKGLGLPIAGVDAQAPAWRAGAMPHTPVGANRLPVYSWWSFATGEHGDFESLVRALNPGPAGSTFGRRAMDVSRPGYGLDGRSTAIEVELEGALRPPAFQRVPFPSSPGNTFASALRELVDLTEDLALPAATALPHPLHSSADSAGYPSAAPDDPIITPPAYGASHAGVRRVADAENDADLAWLEELNTDPRSRAVASVGADVVRSRQEELMARAWAQLDDLEAAQQRMREVELAASVSDRMYEKHYRTAPDDRMLTLTGAMQSRVLVDDRTVLSRFNQSKVPAASRSAAFKRASRPQRKLMRRLTGAHDVSGIQNQLIARLNQEPSTLFLSAAPPTLQPAASVTLAEVRNLAAVAVGEFVDVERPERFLFAELVATDLRARASRNPPEDLDAVALPGFRAALLTALDARIPAAATGDAALERMGVLLLVQGIVAVGADGPDRAKVTLTDQSFQMAFGAEIAGKFFRGVTIARSTPNAGAPVAPMTGMQELAQLGADLSSFDVALAARPKILAAPALMPSVDLAARLRHALLPRSNLAQRVGTVLPGAAASGGVRLFAPVREHPRFDDPVFEDLRKVSQDLIIPNFSDLPDNSLTVLESNQRFIEAYMAGLNHEMSRELRWREFPTDLRGTYFSRFWETQDEVTGAARPDIIPMHTWGGELGANTGRSGRFLVLVVRGALLKAFPRTIVFAQRAEFSTNTGPRVLAPETPQNVLHPAFQGMLEPDIGMYGFALTTAEAKGRRPGDPGWFFVFKERPGEVRLGLDEPNGPSPSLPLASWNDLRWDHLVWSALAPHHVSVKSQPATLSVSPPGPGSPLWARSSADLASILLQSPVIYARHAEEMLP